MDNIRSLLECGIVNPDTLVTIHTVRDICGRRHEVQLTGRFSEPQIERHYCDTYDHFSYSASTDFLDIWTD